MKTVSHRGFNPLPSHIKVQNIDVSLKSMLQWNLNCDSACIMWNLEFQFTALSAPCLASYQHAVRVFCTQLSPVQLQNTIGIILYNGPIPQFEMKEFSEYLHEIAACIPDELEIFALFEGYGSPITFSKIHFPHIHLGFSSGPIGVVKVGKDLIPLFNDATIGIVVPDQHSDFDIENLNKCMLRLEKERKKYLLIGETQLFEQWDGVDTLVCFDGFISNSLSRMIQGFVAAEGEVVYFGVEGFEPPTFCSQSRRASQAALYPDY